MKIHFSFTLSSAGRAVILLLLGLWLSPGKTPAHWCHDIYQDFARIVVKPERQTIDVPVGGSGTLKVRVRNNFPYGLRHILLRATPPAGLQVTVSPSQAEARDRTVYSGQEVTFTLTIQRSASGSNDVAALNLEVLPEVEDVASWRGMDDWWVAQHPAESEVRNRIQTNPMQSHSLLYATLADLPNCSSCEADGVSELLNLFDQLTNNLDSQWPQIFLRAGHQLAVRLRFRNFNNPSRSTVVSRLLARTQSGDDLVRSMAAFFLGYGGNDSGVLQRLQQMASSDSSESAKCGARAGLLMLGENRTSEVTSCMNSNSVDERIRLSCAAALGIMGDDNPVVNFLMPQVSTGTGTSYNKLVGSYFLQLVVLVRRGGPEGQGQVSFLEEEQPADSVPPRAPQNLGIQPI
jgi:hypothetical protein